MAGRWRRMGLICAAPPGHPWWASHAQMPCVLPLSGSLWRIYFSARTADNRSRVLAIDVDPTAGMAVRARHEAPLLDRGPLGAFDQAGVLASCAVPATESVRLYYIGLVERKDVRAQAAIGLAVSPDGLAFTRGFPGPVHGVGPHDPFFNSAPMLAQAGDEHRLYYVGGTGWAFDIGAMEPTYGVRLTKSRDGRLFSAESAAVVAPALCPAVGLGRPWVAPLHGAPRLWFSVRGVQFRAPGPEAYRLVSAPLDGAGLACGAPEPVVFDNPPQPGEFDSWMQAYACVVSHGEDLVMFYNGDDFGATGFGWAVLPGGART